MIISAQYNGPRAKNKNNVSNQLLFEHIIYKISFYIYFTLQINGTEVMAVEKCSTTYIGTVQ